MCEQYELVVGTVNFMSLRTHRWRDSTYTSDAGREIAASIDLQPPEANYLLGWTRPVRRAAAPLEVTSRVDRFSHLGRVGCCAVCDCLALGEVRR